MTTLHQVVNGYIAFAKEPWIYLVMIVFVLIQYRRAHRIERASFGVKVSLLMRQWILSVAVGLLSGVVVSFAFAWFHAPIGVADVVWVWALTLLFAIVDTRLTCVSYAAAVLGLLQPLARYAASLGVQLPAWLHSLTVLHAGALLLLAGLLHVVEGLLIAGTGAGGANPLFVQSRRGQIVGAYLLQKFWPIALVVSIGSSFAPFPVLLGFGNIALGSVPKRVALRAWPFVAGYGLIVAALAAASLRWPLPVWVSAIVAGLLHEGTYHALRIWEENATPLFVRPNRGVRVLAVVPGTPASRLGVEPGETILKVSGMAVNSPYDIHFAIDQNPAYVKLEVLDLHGEIRFLGTPVYTEDPHQLGMIVVPDDHAREYAAIYRLSIGAWMWRWWSRKRTAEESDRVVPVAGETSYP